MNCRRSILCLDGKNVSEQAEWGENALTLRPGRALSQGKHTVEASLRDRLGNLSYHRIEFTVGQDDCKETQQAQAAERPGIARSIRAALFFANVFSTLKDLFFEKK